MDILFMMYFLGQLIFEQKQTLHFNWKNFFKVKKDFLIRLNKLFCLLEKSFTFKFENFECSFK